ncbi:MAG: glycosyltransferase family 2 protein [Zetaproteobacteria bacterium]|nr:glycosyltransferase family 2 protein [Zetaproteobacteria bacterium]
MKKLKGDASVCVVILTYNEEIHIKRCIKSLEPIASKIFIVDSFSSDKTVEIAESLGAVVAQRKWKNYADQFQWGLDNCGAESQWVMRMDADEYLEPDLLEELPKALNDVSDEITGFYIRRKVLFYGKWIKHGGFYPHTLLRVWRNGQGRIEQRWMDEHIVLPELSKTTMLKGHLVDDNLKGMTFWIDKHNSYASREMVDLLNNKYHLLERDDSLKTNDDPQAKWKRIMKDDVYSRLPLALRSTIYFLYRYFLRLGFLDGGKGFIWHFMQGYWYRMLVDVKIMEIEERSGGDVAKIKQILSEEHGIKL